MVKFTNQHRYWNIVADGWHERSYQNTILAEHKKNTYIRLINRWANLAEEKLILKTDLFAEAMGPEQFLFNLPNCNGNIVGIDVSTEIVELARQQAKQHDIDSGRYFCCDVRSLPIRDNSIDLIISDSTLDHFPTEEEIINSLNELARVLKPGGTMILTIDNSQCISYPPYVFLRLWMLMGLSPYFIGRTLSLRRIKQVLAKSGIAVLESTAILHYPHPDGWVRWLEKNLHILSRGRLDGWILNIFERMERLEQSRARFLTGRYLAVKAVKTETAKS